MPTTKNMAKVGMVFIILKKMDLGNSYDGVLRATGLPQADGLELQPLLLHRQCQRFYQTGTTYQHGFSVNAGTSDSYVLSANKVKTEFVVNGDQLERNSFLFKAGKIR
jgi:hypothetical protein